MVSRQIKEIASDARTKLRLVSATKIAARSGVNGYHTGAVIVNGDSPCSHGWSHYSERYSFTEYPRSIHAELHAILRAPTRQSLVGASIYIANIRAKSGNIALAKPCKFCESLLYEVKIKNVYFTIDENSWGHYEIGY